MGASVWSARGFAVLAAATVVAGCGAGGTHTNVPDVRASVRPAAIFNTSVKLQLSIPIRTPSATARATKYISSATQGMRVVQTASGATIGTTDVALTTGSPNCTTSGTTVACTVTISASTSTDAMTVSLYSSAPGSFSSTTQLGSASVSGLSLKADQSNVLVPIVILPTVTQFSLSAPLLPAVTGGGSSYATATLTVQASDLTGTTITGTFDAPYYITHDATDLGISQLVSTTTTTGAAIVAVSSGTDTVSYRYAGSGPLLDRLRACRQITAGTAPTAAQCKAASGFVSGSFRPTSVTTGTSQSVSTVGSGSVAGIAGGADGTTYVSTNAGGNGTLAAYYGGSQSTGTPAICGAVASGTSTGDVAVANGMLYLATQTGGQASLYVLPTAPPSPAAWTCSGSSVNTNYTIRRVVSDGSTVYALTNGPSLLKLIAGTATISQTETAFTMPGGDSIADAAAQSGRLIITGSPSPAVMVADPGGTPAPVVLPSPQGAPSGTGAVVWDSQTQLFYIAEYKSTSPANMYSYPSTGSPATATYFGNYGPAYAARAAADTMGGLYFVADATAATKPITFFDVLNPAVNSPFGSIVAGSGVSVVLGVDGLLHYGGFNAKVILYPAPPIGCVFPSC